MPRKRQVHEVRNSRSQPPSDTAHPIRVLGDPVLRTPCEQVNEFSNGLTGTIDEMFSSMYAARGVGLAANQIGLVLSAFVFDCPDDDDKWHSGYLLNPRIAEISQDPMLASEGCLSVPGFYGELPRPAGVSVVGRDTDGGEVEVEATGYFARCLIHEFDHLQGTVFIDRLDGDQRRAALRYIRRELPSRIAASRGV